MAVRLRLQRHGRKQRPYYYVVAADARAPRDGRFIERIGSYNPTTQPATIDVNVDAAVKWLQNGAEPTETVRAILSYTGALYKNHLMTGVRKGAFDLAEAETRFQAWASTKENKISGHSNSIQAEKEAQKKLALDAEKAVNEKRRIAAEELAASLVEVTEENTEIEASAESSPEIEGDTNETSEGETSEGDATEKSEE
jgi:small subunit ribosomal protein S16